MTTRVDRQEPRNKRIISAVSPAAIAPSRNNESTEALTNTDWSNSSLISMPGGAEARATLQRLLDLPDDIDSRGIAVFDDAQQDRTPPIRSHHVLLHQRAVADIAEILDKNRGA